MDKKQKLFNTLNNHFGVENEFPEIYQIEEEDIEKIIALYEQEASKGEKDPWHYLYFDKLIMQKCVYEIIKDNPKYNEITDKIGILYEKELSRRLERQILDGSEPTGEIYRASYAEMTEESLTLAEICCRRMQKVQKYIADLEHMRIFEIENALSTYETIKSNLSRVGKQMPYNLEQIAAQTKEIIEQAKKEKEAIAKQKEEEEERIERERQQQRTREIEQRQRTREIERQQRITEIEQQRAEEREQARIYNLIFSEENERLKSMRSIYTAWDLGNKRIPTKYQGMTYEQVEALLNKRKAEEKARQAAKEERDKLIIAAIRKSLGVSEDYHLNDVQIRNLSVEFMGYSDDKLREYISDTKKQEETPEVKQQPTTSTTSYDEFEKKLVEFIERKESNLGKVAEILSVTGYPDSTYEVKFEDGSIHQIIITQAEEDLIGQRPQTEVPIQTQTTPERKAEQAKALSKFSTLQPQLPAKSTFIEEKYREEKNRLDKVVHEKIREEILKSNNKNVNSMINMDNNNKLL